MKLFHYTTIDTLAHILNNRSIKFNRLDQLDDKTESEAFADFNPLRYIFSSSFTDDPNENIALWRMYADMERGVRLEFESSTMFSPKNTPLSQHSIKGTLPTSIYTAINSSDIINEDFILVFWEPLEDHSLGQGSMRGGNELDLEIVSLIGRESRAERIVLEDMLPGMSRMRAHLFLTGEKELVVEIEDLGFGSFRPATHQVWRKQIAL